MTPTYPEQVKALDGYQPNALDGMLDDFVPDGWLVAREAVLALAEQWQAEREAKDAEIQRLTEQRDDAFNELKSVDIAVTGEGMLFAPKFTRRCQKVLKLAQRAKATEAERDTLRARVTALEAENARLKDEATR